MPLESQLQQNVIKKIQETYKDNVWIYKTHDLCRVGVPDIVMCFYGHFVAIELKRAKLNKLKFPDENKRRRPRNRPFRKKWDRDPEKLAPYRDSDATPLQKYNIKKINYAQGSAFIGRSTQAIMDRLEKIREAIIYFEK